jgi:hypothetical protein
MAQKGELESRLAQAELALARQMNDMLSQNMTKACFQRCVTAPVEGKLGDKPRRCLDACLSTYLEGFQIAVRVGAECPLGADLKN